MTEHPAGLYNQQPSPFVVERRQRMGAMNPHDLLRQWSNDDVSAEMAIGHMLQHLVKLHATVDALKETVARLHNEPAVDSARSEQQPSLKQKQRSGRR